MSNISGSGGGGCFRKGTLIQQNDGKQIPIELLNVGDCVLSYDENGALYESTVTEIHYHKEVEPLIRVKFWKGFIDITPNHWVLNQYNSFVEVGRLSIEDAFIDGMGHLRPIISINSIESEPVWNLTVSPNHTFIANNIKVHNGGYRITHPVAGSGGGGGKGGGGSQHVPVESPDSLHSKQFAKLIDLVSEGEIHGLADSDHPLRCVYLDGTPIESSSGTLNFSGLTWYSRPGTASQTYIPGFDSVEVPTDVSQQLLNTSSRIYTITNTNVNAVKIILSFSSLTYQNPSNGDLTGSSVQILIDLSTNGSVYTNIINDVISGKTTSIYQRSYRIDLPPSGPWNIRVSRATNDSNSSNHRNPSMVSSYIELIDSKFRYPNSAIFAASIDSSQFSTIPTRGYDIKGIKVKIPNNYNPLTRAYTGIWNGEFTTAWTDNPAWCFYDMVTESRYGLGEFINQEQVDKWALYSIAQYCDELVNNGYGSTEPRFTCNLYLQTKEEAIKVLSTLASIFRGIVYWAGGVLTAVQDAPKDPAAIFTPANVIDGEFNYEGTSAKARHTVVLVSWNDPSDLYKQKIEYVEDVEGISRFGIVQSDLIAAGCTSRGQAHRLGRWLLYTERLESEVVSFKTGLEGLRINPGDIIKTSDPVRSSSRLGGRVTAATTTDVYIDQEVSLVLGQTYTLWALLPDGTVESKTLAVGTTGNTSHLTVSSAYSAAPEPQAMWVLGTSSAVPETWRIVSISETDQVFATVTASAYREDKFDAVENDLILEPLSVSLASAESMPVTNLAVTESLYMVGPGSVGVRASLSWTPSITSYSYIIKYNKLNESIVTVTSNISSIDIGPITSGYYTFQVISVNSLGKKSTINEVSKEIYGFSTAPQDVTGFNISVVNSSTAFLTWNPSTDLDVLFSGGGTTQSGIRIRHSKDLVNPEWSINCTDCGFLPGNATSAHLPLNTGSYLAKWVDSSNNESVNAVHISVDAEGLTSNHVSILIRDPAEGFNGTHTNTVFDPISGGLKLSNSVLFDDLGGPPPNIPIDLWLQDIDSIEGISNTGEYEFTTYEDLGKVYECTIRRDLDVLAYNAYDQMDYRGSTNTITGVLTYPIDEWGDFDGDAVDVNCDVYMKTTQTDPSGTPVWSDWIKFSNTTYFARALRFKAVLTNKGVISSNILVKEIKISIDTPDRFEYGTDVLSGVDGISNVLYTRPFFSLNPNLVITTQNMNSGDYYTVSSKSNTGFTISFKNSGGTGVPRTFDWQAGGY